MSYKTTIKYMPMQTLDSASLTGSFQALGDPLAYAASIVKVVNSSNSTVTISTDGTTDHDVCPGGTFFLYDLTANKTSPVPGIFIEKGTQFYVSGSSGTGNIYLIALYIDQGVYP